MKLIGMKKIMGGLALAGAFALTGVVGVAQQTTGQQGGERAGREWKHKGGKGEHGRGMRGGLFGGRLAEKLNLTDAQKEQMKQIAARHRESTKALREQLRAARGGNDGILNGTFNEAAVRSAAQARANAQVELAVARARMMSEMYNVLTPEQKTLLATERQQREQKRQERRARRGANTTDQN